MLLWAPALEASSTSLHASPREDFVLPYSIQPIYYNLRDGMRLPLVHQDAHRYYYQIVYSGQLLTVAWAKVNAGAQAHGNELHIQRARNESLNRAYFFFDADKSYPVLERDGEALRIAYPGGSQTIALRVQARLFRLSTTGGDAPETGAATRPEASEATPALAALQERKVALRSSRPEALLPEDYHRAICRLQGGSHTGLGFVLWMSGNYYVVTNQQIALRQARPIIRTLDNQTLTAEAIEVAHDRGLARILIAQTPPAFASIRTPEFNESIDALAIQEASAELAVSSGRVTGIGPGVMQTDLDLAPANQGGPVIAHSDGALLGVANYQQFLRERALEAPEAGLLQVNRAGILIEDAIRWQHVSWEQAARSRQQYTLLNSFALETVGLLQAVWPQFKRPLNARLTDPALSRWLIQRNGMLVQWNDHFRAYPQANASPELDQAFQQSVSQYLRDQITHHNRLHSLLQTRSRQAQNLQPYPQTPYTEQLISTLRDTYERSIEIIEALNQRITQSPPQREP